jgi:uncharacterized Rmd1/YagE family protein
VTNSSPSTPSLPTRITARAIMLGQRLDTNGLERSDMISSAPLAFRVGEKGFAALFRYGVVVMVGMSPLEEDDFLRMIKPRVTQAISRIEDETALINIAPDMDDQVPPGGPVRVKNLAPERLLTIADALAKSVALAHDEKAVSAVFDVIDPLASALALTGKTPGNRRSILKLIGQSLLVQHRMSGRVAVEEKPDVLWDRPDLERLYARLEDEYELKERAGTLNRKLQVVNDTAQALTDLIDAERSLRLEITIATLIVFEIGLTLYQMWRSWH